MSNKYQRLCAESRKVIANMKQAGKAQSEIAQAIGLSQSAISNVLARNIANVVIDLPKPSALQRNGRARKGPAQR